MKSATLIGMLCALTALTGCSEWRTFPLRNPTTGAEAVCAIHWGTLSDEDIQRIHECVEACEAHGFRLQSPESVPPAAPPVKSAKPPSIPLACQG
jgi:hypothetical protein